MVRRPRPPMARRRPPMTHYPRTARRRSLRMAHPRVQTVSRRPPRTNPLRSLRLARPPVDYPARPRSVRWLRTVLHRSKLRRMPMYPPIPTRRPMDGSTMVSHPTHSAASRSRASSRHRFRRHYHRSPTERSWLLWFPSRVLLSSATVVRSSSMPPSWTDSSLRFASAFLSWTAFPSR